MGGVQKWWDLCFVPQRFYLCSSPKRLCKYYKLLILIISKFSKDYAGFVNSLVDNFGHEHGMPGCLGLQMMTRWITHELRKYNCLLDKRTAHEASGSLETLHTMLGWCYVESWVGMVPFWCWYCLNSTVLISCVHRFVIGIVTTACFQIVLLPAHSCFPQHLWSQSIALNYYGTNLICFPMSSYPESFGSL